MIIKATRIRTGSGHGKLLRHLLRTDENEQVLILRGTEHDLIEAVKDAHARHNTYALRHVIFSPDEPLRKGQLGWLQKTFREEFKADGLLFAVRHDKKRAGNTVEAEHYHLIYAEALETGLVLDSRFSKRRHEKIARLAEIEFGHALTLGKGTQAVIHALEANGKARHADVLRAATYEDDRTPDAAFTHAQHQATKRRSGQSVLPAMRADILTLWNAHHCILGDFINAANEVGLLIFEGDKDGVYLIEDDARNRLALHRVLGLKKRELAHLMQNANHPAPKTPKPLKARDVMEKGLVPVCVPPRPVQDYFDGLASIIRPQWTRAECRPKIISRPWRAEIRRLENMSLEEELSRHLEALIARMLNALFGWNLTVPVTSAEDARELVNDYARRCAENRQSDVQEHFRSPSVRAALRERRKLRKALLSRDPEIVSALELGLFDNLLLPRRETHPTPAASNPVVSARPIFSGPGR
ncbi:hypothetical protein AA100600_3028 [Gluconobacter thailandicus F149-1 = NBRC 100600]|uniref:hypothetical protein n=1 Tax=Gluconobacter thailandicus TaxID=257438 RepID=UPI002156787C|nr:hypothetical protein [Gluconobacter thailandicus]GBR61697.1 hypothetical protein AA100600_3028 [Gluconobacter thailandicus F149-1 = NBRC 100600]